MEQWDASPSAPATCPWRPLPVLPRSWSRCQASAASASTVTREAPLCPQCTADPNLQLTRPTPSSPTRPTLTRSLIQNRTGNCTPTNPKRRRTPLATSWWTWGASGTSRVETSTWRVREAAAASPHSECRLFPLRSKASCLCFSHFSLLTHKRPHCEPFPSASAYVCVSVSIYVRRVFHWLLAHQRCSLSVCSHTHTHTALTQHIPLSPSFPLSVITLSMRQCCLFSE